LSNQSGEGSYSDGSFIARVLRHGVPRTSGRADSLVFDDHERGPAETLRYQFEAISRMPEQDQAAIRVLLDAVVVKNQVAGAIERVAKQPAVTVPAPVKAEAKARRGSQAGGTRR